MRAQRWLRRGRAPRPPADRRERDRRALRRPPVPGTGPPAHDRHEGPSGGVEHALRPGGHRGRDRARRFTGTPPRGHRARGRGARRPRCRPGPDERGPGEDRRPRPLRRAVRHGGGADHPRTRGRPHALPPPSRRGRRDRLLDRGDAQTAAPRGRGRGAGADGAAGPPTGREGRAGRRPLGGGRDAGRGRRPGRLSSRPGGSGASTSRARTRRSRRARGSRSRSGRGRSSATWSSSSSTRPRSRRRAPPGS